MMKNIKLSSFIFILVALFLLADLVGYRLLYKQIVENHEKDTKLLFYQLQTETSALLTKLFINFERQKEKLLQKHRSVASYLESHDLNTSLGEIHARINEKEGKPLYNIYIANDKLVITNTTNPKDLGFDLSFAKDIFDKQYEENITGVSTPIREDRGERFLSYTSAYLARNGNPKAALLQVSYTYDNVAREIKAVEELIRKNSFLKSAYAFCYGSEGFVYEFLFMDPSYHRSSTQLISVKQRAGKLLKMLQDNQIVEKRYVQDGIHYKEIYMLATIPLSSEFKVIYTITFDENALYEKLFWLNLIMLMLAILGVIGILFIAKIRRKEQRLSEQDSFVQSAMHEMKTPLSIITLNNELRAMEYGSDSYTREIDSAVKTLRNSYETMSFIITKDAVEYSPERLNLAHIVKERVDFFQSIAISNDKHIMTDLDESCYIHISYIELVRLIDNNLSNAIKYSERNGSIMVTVSGCTLAFHNYGEPIKNTYQIFEKYVRENRTVGGYGLGLNIIREIADKYGIVISVHSDEKEGTTFRYTFPSKEGGHA